MEKFGYPLPNGVVMGVNEKRVVSYVTESGQKRLRTFADKNKILYFHFPFARGLQIFFCGIFAIFNTFFQFFNEKSKKKGVFLKNWIIFAAVLFFAVLFGWFVLGFVPAKIGLWIVSYTGTPILRNVVIAIFKILFFVLTFLTLRLFPSFLELLRFNRALDIVLSENGKKKGKTCLPTNFLNFIIFVFILDFVVITLFGANFGLIFKFFLHLAIFLLCISVGYEILWLLEKYCKKAGYVTAWLVYVKPSTTHLETASIALTELNLLLSQKERGFMEDEKGHSFSVVYNEVKNRLASAGINDKSETDWLIATVLNKNRAEIKLISSITDKQEQEIMKVTARRAKGESLDNIFGFTEFYGLPFDVNKKVLTPRMETEILVEQVLKAEKNFKNAKILDLGTGSGCIAVALAKNCDEQITAIDVSKVALATAEVNAKKNGVKIEFLHSNLFEGLKRKRKFDIIVSNPPYIKTDDIKKLDKNVRECDPLLALDGGEDGLSFYREISQKATSRLTNGGMLFYEVGKGQASAVRKIMRENGFEEIKTIKDYNKIERVVYGRIR